MTRVVCDASPLIALGTIGELDHLTTLTGELVVLPQIQDEVTTEPARTNLSRFIDRHQIDTTDPKLHDHVDRANAVLDASTEHGDVYCIAAVLAYTADDRSIGIVSDDRRVRTVADGLGATVTGTIGVIVRAVDAGLPPAEAKTLVDRLDANGLHMTSSLRRTATTLIDEAADR